MNRALCLLVCCIAWMVTFNALAEGTTEYVTREVIGVGANVPSAIENALIEAMQQINGLDIKASSEFRRQFAEASVTADGASASAESFSSSFQQQISKRTKGQIHSYECVGEPVALEGSRYEVTLRVRVAHYRTPGLSPETRRRMAVMPLFSVQSEWNDGDQGISGYEVARALGERITSRVTQCRRFAVLDRAYSEEHESERALLRSGNVAVHELAKLGMVLGTDYMLVGTLADFSIENIPYEIQISGESGVRQRARVRLDYRIIVMATQQVKWSDTVEVAWNDKDIAASGTDRSSSRIRQAILDAAAAHLVNSMLDNIYPIQVIGVESGEVVLNQGGNSMSIGDFYEVYKKAR
jgi:curli biogenesis system outer membrane secretion channel CsgG